MIKIRNAPIPTPAYSIVWVDINAVLVSDSSTVVCGDTVVVTGKLACTVSVSEMSGVNPLLFMDSATLLKSLLS